MSNGETGNGQWSVEGACVMFCHGPLTARARNVGLEGGVKLGSNYLNNGGGRGKGRESHKAKDVDILRWTSNPK
jgi:hypothetical protein